MPPPQNSCIFKWSLDFLHLPYIAQAKELLELAKTRDKQILIIGTMKLEFYCVETDSSVKYCVSISKSMPVENHIHIFQRYADARNFLEQYLLSL